MEKDNAKKIAKSARDTMLGDTRSKLAALKAKNKEVTQLPLMIISSFLFFLLNTVFVSGVW